LTQLRAVSVAVGTLILLFDYRTVAADHRSLILRNSAVL
jgi:hypothetical protein